MVDNQTQAEIAIIGGSGFYTFLDDAVESTAETPFGRPSSPIRIGAVGGRRVAFLPRHGHKHEFPPHKIPYRANLWALRSLGVTQVLAPCAVGSLRPDLAAGSLVIPDQLVDRTTSRAQTFYDAGANHISFADPYCPVGRARVVDAAAVTGWPATDEATMVVVEGPRFSTRAESRWFSAAGFDLVNMTGHPEAVLARELAMCYTAIAVVTDLDAGLVTGEGVSQAEVFSTFAASLDALRRLLASVIPTLPTQRNCLCARALDDLPAGAQSP